MKLIPSLLIVGGFAYNTGDGKCSKPMFGQNESCKGVKPDDACCTDIELCELYSDRSDFKDKFPKVVCPTTTTSTTTSFTTTSFTTTSMITGDPKPTTKETTTMTTTLPTTAKSVCNTCSPVTSEWNGMLWSLCQDNPECGFDVLKCDADNKFGANGGDIEIMCYNDQFIHIDWAYYGRGTDESRCCTNRQRQNGLCAACQPIDITDYFFINCERDEVACKINTPDIAKYLGTKNACESLANFVEIKFRCEDVPQIAPSTTPADTTTQQPTTTRPSSTTTGKIVTTSGAKQPDITQTDATTTNVATGNTSTIKSTTASMTTDARTTSTGKTVKTTRVSTAPSKTTQETTTAHLRPTNGRPPLTPAQKGSIDELIKMLMPYAKECKDKNINMNYAPRNSNIQNFVDIATDINTNINVNLMGGFEGFGMLDRSMAAKLLAEKLDCSPEQVNKGIHFLERYLEDMINDYMKN